MSRDGDGGVSGTDKAKREKSVSERHAHALAGNGWDRSLSSSAAWSCVVDGFLGDGERDRCNSECESHLGDIVLFECAGYCGCGCE